MYDYKETMFSGYNQGRGLYELTVIVTACIRPAWSQARQNPSVGGGVQSPTPSWEAIGIW